MRKKIYVIVLVFFVMLNIAQFIFNNINLLFYRNEVVSREGAVLIAKAALIQRYGEGYYNEFELVYYATLIENDNIWLVNCLPKEPRFGRSPYVFIRKLDGKVLRVTALYESDIDINPDEIIGNGSAYYYTDE